MLDAYGSWQGQDVDIDILPIYSNNEAAEWLQIDWIGRGHLRSVQPNIACMALQRTIRSGIS